MGTNHRGIVRRTVNDLPLQTPESSSGFDLEADRLRALMRASVFKQKFQPVTVDRFEIVRLLGSGAMGIVYEAIDPRDGEHVALKTLRNHNPRALSLFKKEFRALSQLSHPNLVTLYELGREHKKYFFTMELVRGIALQKYLWGLDVHDADPDDQAGLSASGSIIGLTMSPVTDIVRLRDVFGQLAAGLLALHHAGKLHRDIKPTNVLVTPRGRVVLMDFGFVSEQGLGALESTHSNVVVGTPAFMAPEQAQAAKPSPASDWYSFGATLYMVLTGTPPFSGLPLPEMLHAKQNTRPPPPRRIVRGIPADLDELCTALLDPDPGNRPGEQQIVDTLLGKGASVRPAAVRGAVAHLASGKRGDFIGRKTELDQLMAALAKTQTGKTQAVEVSGRAGMGKTALVRKFTQMVGDVGEAIILKTRCYERDSLEFKVIDGLVDAVIRNLRQRDKAEVRALLPPDTEALVQMFPALLQVRAFKPVVEEDCDRSQLRQRALVALKMLLGSLASVPLVLWIDDLHWSDRASFDGLLTLLCGDGPRLLVASYRESPRHLPLSEFLRKLKGCTCGHETIELAALLPGDALELSERLLARHSPDQTSPKLAQTIASESLGNPLYIHEMVRFFARPQPPGEPARPALTLAGLLHIRVAQLPEDTRYLMEIIAVAGRPITLTHTLAAAGLDGDVRPALQHLINAELLTLSDVDDDQALACSDERASSAVLAQLDGHALRGYHERLARTYEQAGDANPELLAFHYRAAREFELANRYTVAAADLAWDRHDFSQAARHYATAVELNTLDPEVSNELRLKLARALQAAGRDQEAASVLLEAAQEHASGQAEPEQLIEAGLALLLTGNIDRGQKILLEAGVQVGVRPSVPGWRLGQWVRRGALRLRGLKFTPKTENFAPLACTRVDLMWTVALARLLLAPETARASQIRLLRESLALGEPSRVARAIACEAWLAGLPGTRSSARVDELIAYAYEILHQVENPTARGYVGLAETRSQFARGAWPQTLRRAKSARTRMYHEDPTCRRVLWELDWLAALATQKMGRAQPAPAPWSMQMQQADDARDHRAYAAYGALASWQALSEGNLEAANAALTSAVARCPPAPTVRIRLAFVEAEIRLYAGELARSHEVIESTTRSFHQLIAVDQQLRCELRCLQATSLAHGIIAGDPRAGKPAITRLLARLVTEDFPGAAGTAELLRGCLDLFEGSANSARTQFERAQKYFSDVSMARHAAIAGLRAAEVGRDEPGIRSLRYELTELGIFETAIDRLAHMICPRVPS